MLKALELNGFKSFADKTRFEFPEGITVVVGPNGSGKSNIVDAIKWVLGEQSAKSLRGKDMSDVIFKGAGGPNGRKPANSATATIVLDNEDRRFDFAADEVSVGRRVYRSGETEYLINGESTRLKDVKDLFRGTGVGTDAYSLIEQGKVDRMLQASPKDRRAIFEEAAGISRFKAKKKQAQRRLQRVEANLIRLADIVEEVGSRYRSVKAQASKASRYKEYSDRLKELRTFVGLKDWRAFSEKLEHIETERTDLDASSQSLTHTNNEQNAQLKDLESVLDAFSAKLTGKQESSSALRERIAHVESNIDLNRSRLEDLLGRREELETQVTRADSRHHEYKTRISKNEQELEKSELEYTDSNTDLKRLDQQLVDLDHQVETIDSELQTDRAEAAELVSVVANLGRVVSGADSKISQISENKIQLESTLSEQSNVLRRLQDELDSYVEQKKNLEEQAETQDSALASARARLTEARDDREELDELIRKISNKQSGVTQRTKVLQELENRLEGINAGAKELLNQARSATSGPLADIVGVVADLVSVNVQHAGIVDVALGQVAQYLVVDGKLLLDELSSERLKVKGRVGIIQLSSPPTLGADPGISINGQPGVIGRADRLVQVDAQYAGFVQQLLGGTWVVKTLSDAIHLRAAQPNTIRFVTVDGEIVESDGTVVVGPKSVATGLVSRRSELRSLHRELTELDEKLEQCNEVLESNKKLEAESDVSVQRLINENTLLANELSDKSVRAAETEKQILSVSESISNNKTQLESALAFVAELTSQLTQDREQLRVGESRLNELNQKSTEDEGRAAEIRGTRAQIERSATAAKVELAKFEQRLVDMQSRQQQYQSELDEIQVEIERLKTQLDSDLQAEGKAHSEISTGQSELNELVTQRDELAEALEGLTSERNEQDSLRRELAIQLERSRDELRNVKDKQNHLELRAGQLNMERDRLAERLQEDYDIDISKIEVKEENEEQVAERQAIDTEITQLRKKIGTIGSVNLDALSELEDLESRYLAMDEQYQDLVNAKESLEKIITRIDADSRKLFVETLEAIRGNFQKLYRQTFGGGQADIILEEGADPLEAGVEIVATPPGKPQFSNSLLSGGEKALTAVSLLMAIFQFRPSPFCVLDEVDAPFDEANIGRFIDVLKSFLDWTKFVIVTHSKKTMTAATTLYGVTMQESGVSKRVSVKFEDVSEDGHISDSALSRTNSDEDAA